jgi:ribose 5-phosphate isomerase B
MNIAISCDHRGFNMKERLVVLLGEMGHEALDMGTECNKSCDYTDAAWPVGRAVAEGKADRGILICGSGIGMSIAANKIEGVRAALCHDELSAQMSRRHNNANVLCMASDVLGEELIRRIVTSWLTTDFEGPGRHQRRIDKIHMIECGEDPSTYQEG